MALLSFAEDRTEPQSLTLRQPGEIDTRPSKWQKVVLELFGTFLVLGGVVVGTMALRFTLVFIHGVMH